MLSGEQLLSPQSQLKSVGLGAGSEVEEGTGSGVAEEIGELEGLVLMAGEDGVGVAREFGIVDVANVESRMLEASEGVAFAVPEVSSGAVETAVLEAAEEGSMGHES